MPPNSHESRPSAFETMPLDANTIRLLRFRYSSTGTLEGVFRRFHLDRAPPFYIASYTWGKDGYAETPMSTPAGEVLVLKNLMPFLETVLNAKQLGMKDFKADDWWWIDSLCIDQDDETEKEVQVSIMGRIYHKAKRCSIWLGEEMELASDARGGIPFLKYLADINDRLLSQDLSLHTHLRSDQFHTQWNAVGALISRSWWTRVWTLQEYILPSEAKFYCGAHGINRSTFKTALYSMDILGGNDNVLVPRAAYDAAWNRRRILQRWTSTRGSKDADMPLVATLAYLGNQHATDARDRVYSLLGLVSYADQRIILGSSSGSGEEMLNRPAYSQSVELLYTSIVKRFWKTYRSLDIIAFSHLFNSHAQNLYGLSEVTVPSWAPDWRAYVRSSPVPLMASQASADWIGNFRPAWDATYTAKYDAPGRRLRGRAHVRFADDLRQMWCDGVALGEIDQLSGLEGLDTRCYSAVCREMGHVMTQSAPTGPQEKDIPPADAMQLLETLCRSLVLDRADKYLNHRPPESFMSDFILLCLDCYEGGSPEIPVDFNTWFQENRQFSIKGHTLEIIVKSINDSRRLTGSTTVVQLAPSSADPSTRGTVLSRFEDRVVKMSRRLMTTYTDHIGMAPCTARQGDVVVIVFGSSIPLVLRRVGSREAFQVIGEVYVHGYMNGEIDRAVRNGEAVARNFELV